MRKSFDEIYEKHKELLDVWIQQNTHYDKNGMVLIAKDDPWFQEEEWDDYERQLEEEERSHDVRTS